MTTSKKVGKIASKVLRDERYSSNSKSAAGAALEQVSKKGRKGKKKRK